MTDILRFSSKRRISAVFKVDFDYIMYPDTASPTVRFITNLNIVGSIMPS